MTQYATHPQASCLLHSCFTNADDPEVFKNAPVGLQLVGHTLEDEAVIGMTEIVDAALKSFSNKAKL